MSFVWVVTALLVVDIFLNKKELKKTELFSFARDRKYTTIVLEVMAVIWGISLIIIS